MSRAADEGRRPLTPPPLLSTPRPPRLPRPARARRFAAAALAALVVVFARAARPDRPLPLDVCLFRRATGRPCLTCGMTRAVCAFARGDWARGLAWHPDGALVVAALAVAAVWLAAEGAAGRPLASRARRRLLVVFVALGAAVAVVLWAARLAGVVAWPPRAD